MSNVEGRKKSEGTTVRGLRFVIDIKKSDERTFMEALHELIKRGIVKTKNVHYREQEISV